MNSFTYFHKTGRMPVDDQLDMANCERQGEPGHHACGICEHGQPRAVCIEGCSEKSLIAELMWGDQVTCEPV